MGKGNVKAATAKGKRIIAFPTLCPKASILSRILGPAALNFCSGKQLH